MKMSLQFLSLRGNGLFIRMMDFYVLHYYSMLI